MYRAINTLDYIVVNLITPSRGAGYELRFKSAPHDFERIASVSRFLESKFYENLINFRSHHNKTDHSYK